MQALRYCRGSLRKPTLLRQRAAYLCLAMGNWLFAMIFLTSPVLFVVSCGKWIAKDLFWYVVLHQSGIGKQTKLMLTQVNGTSSVYPRGPNDQVQGHAFVDARIIAGSLDLPDNCIYSLRWLRDM